MCFARTEIYRLCRWASRPGARPCPANVCFSYMCSLQRSSIRFYLSMGWPQHFQLKCLITVTHMFAGYIRLIIQCIYASMYSYMLHNVCIHVGIACTDVCALLFCSVKKKQIADMHVLLPSLMLPPHVLTHHRIWDSSHEL